jgi:hypothetical protein
VVVVVLKPVGRRGRNAPQVHSTVVFPEAKVRQRLTGQQPVKYLKRELVTLARSPPRGERLVRHQ